jgi:4-hydroxybenzoate polyprenyltransferase
MHKLGLYVQCLRPKQWVKNLVLLAGLIFSRNLFEPGMAARGLGALGIFCLLSGAIYVFNDLRDYNRDKAHPNKRSRPIASGRVSRMEAAVLGLVVAVIGLVLASMVNTSFLWVSLAYVVLQIAYSLGLKHMVVLDVLIISLGFVLRAIAGVEALKDLDPGVVISPWLLVCTLFLALFLGFSKRRHELNLLEDNASQHRKTLDDYSAAFLDAMIIAVAAATLIAYAIYTIWGETVVKFGTDRLIYTVPFVVYGLFRYMYLVMLKNRGGSPSEVLLTDVPLIVDIILWIIVAGLLIYAR